MVINHLEKLFVTSDASTIVTEMDVYHPAAKLLVMAAKAQAGEVGDGTNLVSWAYIFLAEGSACSSASISCLAVFVLWARPPLALPPACTVGCT